MGTYDFRLFTNCHSNWSTQILPAVPRGEPAGSLNRSRTQPAGNRSALISGQIAGLSLPAGAIIDRVEAHMTGSFSGSVGYAKFASWAGGLGGVTAGGFFAHNASAPPWGDQETAPMSWTDVTVVVIGDASGYTLAQLAAMQFGYEFVFATDGASFSVSDFFIRFTFTLSLTPNVGSTQGGDVVTIGSSGGISFVNGVTIEFDPSGTNLEATSIVVQDSNTVTCKTPPHDLGPVDVLITNPGDAPVLLSQIFTYVITVLPPSGSVLGAQRVQIVGSGFVQPTSPALYTVSFGGDLLSDPLAIQQTMAKNVLWVDGDHLTCLTPGHVLGPVDVTIMDPTSDETSITPAAFAYVITVVPRVGPATGGTLVKIIGSGFAAGATVTFDGVPATSVQVVDGSTIKCLTPAHVAAVVDVVVMVPQSPPPNVIDTGFGAYTYGSQTGVPQIGGSIPNPQGPAPATVTTQVTVTPGANNGALTYAWTQVSGPSSTTFGSPSAMNTTITFTTYTPGTYVFQLAITTSGVPALPGSKSFTVTVPPPTAPTIQ
jgi:hypothetical protein